MGAERERMRDTGRPEDGLRGASPWYEWGPYLAERAWGTVREDYSADGDPWHYTTHDMARSYAYRWGEEGLGGLSDAHQRLCLALALWNGRDPILKERIFGLANDEGNHGEDAKEYWWHLDATPSSSYLRWRYHYPQSAFPYEALVAENRRRTRDDPEYELLDTGVFDDDRYWVVEVEYAKADPTDVLMRVTVRNAGPESAGIDVLPTAWFRNDWRPDPGRPKPVLRAEPAGGPGGGAGVQAIRASHRELGEYLLHVGPAPGGTGPELLFCENETNTARLYGAAPLTPYPKDGIGDHVIHGTPTVDPARSGTKAAARYRLTVDAGATAELRLRLRPTDAAPLDDPLGASFSEVLRRRGAEADEFYEELRRSDASDEEQRVMRGAFAGLLWSRQFYAYDVARWLDGDPGAPPPPPERRRGRNSDWRNVDAFDILSMPDTWEYPWFATWDLAFHAVALAHVDPAFAKYQLLVLCREWFQHPSGALPAYEWDFGDVNPPVHAWAALRVWEIDGRRDTEFLERIFHKLLLAFAWWLNRHDTDGNDLFSGGFLGLDNISAFDRSQLPVAGVLEQSDASAWMAFFAMSMGRLAATLAERDPAYLDMVTTFVEHTVRIAVAMNLSGLWDDEDGFYYDALSLPDGSRVPIRLQSMVGVIPVLPCAFVRGSWIERIRAFGKHFAHFLSEEGLTPETLRRGGSLVGRPGRERMLFSVVGPSRLAKILETVFDESAFLSPYGLRSLSARYRRDPFRIEVAGVAATVAYEPAESRSAMYGGNSNWRGPVWFPLNYLVIESLRHWDDWYGGDFTVEYPTGSGRRLTLLEVARDLARRLVAIWLPGPDGRRPVWGGVRRFQLDADWRDSLLYFEYFEGDDGAGLGASHQTGWTALVAHLLVKGGTLDPDVRRSDELADPDRASSAASDADPGA